MPAEYLIEVNSPIRGHPLCSLRVLNACGQRHLARIVCCNCQAAVAQIAPALNTFTRTHTQQVNSEFIEHGIGRATRMILLAPQNRTQCHTWAQNVINRNLKNWQRLALSDELWFELFQTNGCNTAPMRPWSTSKRLWCLNRIIIAQMPVLLNTICDIFDNFPDRYNRQTCSQLNSYVIWWPDTCLFRLSHLELFLCT